MRFGLELSNNHPISLYLECDCSHIVNDIPQGPGALNSRTMEAQSLIILFLSLLIPLFSNSSVGFGVSFPVSCPGVLAFIKPGRGGSGRVFSPLDSVQIELCPGDREGKEDRSAPSKNSGP